MNILNLFIPLLMASGISASPGTEIDQTSRLEVITLYDKNGDGLREGVGPNVLVELMKNNESLGFSFTDQFSSVRFTVLHGHYEAAAYPPRTSPFFRWKCFGGKSVDMPEEFLIIECQPIFSIQLPFLHK